MSKYNNSNVETKFYGLLTDVNEGYFYQFAYILTIPVIHSKWAFYKLSLRL
jgi:hypothetical protein